MSVGALLDDGFVRHQAVLPHHAERAAIFSGAAGIREEPVFIDKQWILRLDDLDGRIRHVAEPIGSGILTVLVGTTAASGDVVEFHMKEALAVGIDTGDRQAKLVASRAGWHATRIEFGNGPSHHRTNAVTALTSRADSCRELRVHQHPGGAITVIGR